MNSTTTTELPSEDFTPFNTTATLDLPSADTASLAMSRTLMCIGIATVIMNIFVFAIFAAYREMRSHANTIICSMAVTDLIAGFVTIINGAGKWTDWFSIRGIFCDVYYVFDLWSAMASIGHVLLVNLERYMTIVFPLSNKRIVSTGRVKIAIVIVWVASLGHAIGYRLCAQMDDECLWVAAEYPGVAFGLLMTSLALPFLSILVIYTHIVVVIVKKLRFMADSSNLDEAALARSQRKVFATVSAILGAWVVCWLPFTVVVLVITGAQAAGLELDMGQFVTMLYYMEVMSYGNSLLNPILYFLTSADFRDAALVLFRCRVRREAEGEELENTKTSQM